MVFPIRPMGQSIVSAALFLCLWNAVLGLVVSSSGPGAPTAAGVEDVCSWLMRQSAGSRAAVDAHHKKMPGTPAIELLWGSTRFRESRPSGAELVSRQDHGIFQFCTVLRTSIAGYFKTQQTVNTF